MTNPATSAPCDSHAAKVPPPVPTQAQVDAVFAAVTRDLLARRSRILSRARNLEGLPREIVESAAAAYLADANALRRCFERLAK